MLHSISSLATEGDSSILLAREIARWSPPEGAGGRRPARKYGLFSGKAEAAQPRRVTKAAAAVREGVATVYSIGSSGCRRASCFCSSVCIL